MSDGELPKGIVRSKPLSPETSPPGPLSLPERGSSLRRRLPPEEASPDFRLPLSGRERGPGGEVSGRITALEPQARREGRLNVFVDGKFAIGLFAEVAEALGLRVGQAMTPERLAELAAAETLRRAKEDAYHLLSFRDRSEGELVERLRRKGYEDDAIAGVQEHLHAVGFLDDTRFAERWVAARGVGRGRRALQHELRAKGVDAETIGAALDAARADNGDAEREAALREAWKKVGNKRPADTSREAQAKLSAYLARRGFDWATIRPALTAIFENSDEAEDFESTAEYTEGIPAE